MGCATVLATAWIYSPITLRMFSGRRSFSVFAEIALMLRLVIKDAKPQTLDAAMSAAGPPRRSRLAATL